MRNRQNLWVIISAAICLLLAGCGTAKTGMTGSASAQSSEQYEDQAFIKSLSKGLQERWKLNDEDEKKYSDVAPSDDEYVDMRNTYVDAELNQVSRYTDAKFEDQKLKEKAIAYVNCLNDQKKAMEYYASANYEEYDELWNSGLDERSKLIEDFVNEYGLTVDEKYEDTLKKMLTNSELVKSNEEDQKKLDELLNSAKFECVKEEGGWKTYSAIIENTTGITFTTLQVYINLLDQDGVIVETEYDDISNFQSGQKAKLEFLTDQTFVSTQVTASYWDS